MATSNLPDGHPPSLGMTAPVTPSPSILTDSNNPEEAAAMLAAALQEAEIARKKQAWASWVNSEYTKCRSARTPFERQWYLNLAFLAGKQYVSPLEIASQGFRLTTPKAPPWRVRMVVNKIRTAVRTECSKLTTSKPIPTVMPATNENEDYSAAAVGEQILKSRFATADYEGIYRSWIWWGVVCGTSFIKQYWDPQELDYESKSLPPWPTFPNGEDIPQEIMEIVDPEWDYNNQEPQPAVGKIQIERVTPFHIYAPDLLSEEIEKQPYIIHVMTKSPLWVEQRYGFKPHCDTRASSTILDAATIITKGTEDHLDSVMVKEVWIKPYAHKDFPQGGVLTVINDRVVQSVEKWPYPFPEFPFYKYNGIPTGGFYSDSNIVDLIPLQKEYNRKRSSMIEIQNTMGKPKLVYPKGSINPRMISSEPGQSIPYTPGYEKPEVLPGAEVPMSFVTEIQQLQVEFDDISGQHEISRGGTPNSAISSGTAIAFLQEQDDAKLNYQVSSIENAQEMLGKHYLTFASSYWDNNRLVRITGKDNAFEALHWKKGMLKGNTDVKIQTGSALPYSKAARTALLMEMIQNGLVDPQSGLEMLDFGGLDKIIADALIDKRQAVRENLKMCDIPEQMLKLLLEPAPGPNGEEPIEIMHPQTGQPVQLNGDGTPFQPQPPIPVNSWDNHEAHIMWHNHFRKTQEFELLPDLNKQAFEMHVQLHQLAMQANIVNQQNQIIQANSAMPVMEEGEFAEEDPAALEQDTSGGQVPPPAQ